MLLSAHQHLEIHTRCAYFGLVVNSISKKRTIVTNAVKETPVMLFDIDCNFTHEALAKDTDRLIESALKQNVRRYLVPGSSLEDSERAIELAKAKTLQYQHRDVKFYSTAGIHPYQSALEENGKFSVADAMQRLRDLSKHCEAIGECGLDFSEGFPGREIQEKWFEPQVALACELQKPLFLHERMAHEPFLKVLQKYKDQLPATLVHCFTGTAAELQTYLNFGCYVSFSGVICRDKAGAELRSAITSIKPFPLDRIMIETDAPYLGFPRCQSNEPSKSKKTFPNVPSSLPMVLARLASLLDIDPMTLQCAALKNSESFLQLQQQPPSSDHA